MINWDRRQALRETLWLASHGKYQKEIAQLRHVSLRTVETQWHTIMVEMGAENMTHAVAMALREGVIQ